MNKKEIGRLDSWLDKMKGDNHLMRKSLYELVKEIPPLKDLDIFINDFDHGWLRVISYIDGVAICLTEYQEDTIEYSINQIDTFQLLELIEYLLDKVELNLED